MAGWPGVNFHALSRGTQGQSFASLIFTSQQQEKTQDEKKKNHLPVA